MKRCVLEALAFNGPFGTAWYMFQTSIAKDCFLKQPEMPCDVVKMPLSTSPTVKISGSFSFEEGGPGWERWGSNMGGSEAEVKEQNRIQQPTRIQQLRFNNQNAGFNNHSDGFNNHSFNNQQSRNQQPKHSTTKASATNKAGFNNQKSRIQQPKQPDSTTMASATKKAGFNNQTIQQPRLQQPAKPDSTTKTPDSTTTIFNNQGFNNQKSRIQQPRVNNQNAGFKNQGWGGWGVYSLRFPLPFAWSKSWKNGCGVGWVGG